jgi:hypothetical protein
MNTESKPKELISQLTSLSIVAALSLLLLGYCSPVPAQGLRDPFSTIVVPARDPFYTQYPFQTPAQASRELDARTYRARELDAITSSIDNAQRRSEDAAWQRDFQRRLEEIK